MSVERTRSEKSSNVYSHGHDPDEQELHVQYGTFDKIRQEMMPGNDLYIYPCSAEEYEAMKAADSIGSHIRKTFGNRTFKKRPL